MWRPALVSAVVAFSFLATQAQVQSHGVPASILSPGPDSSPNGPSSSILSPTPARGPNGRVFFGNQKVVRFGHPRLHRGRHEIVPVPIFIPAYLPPDYGVSEADPPLADQSSAGEAETSSNETDALREAYNRGAHDALAARQRDDRYGEHYLDSREKTEKSKPPVADDRAAKPTPKDNSDEQAAPEPEQNSPAAVFIFKDGHKLEIQNFAIVGQTLFDFSSTPLRKIKLAELDLDATRKANDDLGNNLRLP